MKNKNCNTKEKFYETLIMIGGILFMGVVLPIVFGLFSNKPLNLIFENIFFSTISTALIWAGCRYIVLKIWTIFPWEKHPVKHLIWEIFSIIAYNLIAVGVIFICGYCYLTDEAATKYNFIDIYTGTVIVSLVITFIHEGVYLYIEWMKSNKRSQELEKESLLSQFETLKNQVNPHFLFNSFNTLITLIEEDKESAVEYVQKLSDFFRTILQLRDKSVISISEELELINTYIYLQKKRYGDNLIMNTSIPDVFLTKGVAPLTLQMLVENAIKHNIIATGRPLIIDISVNENNYIIVKNNVQKRIEEEPSAGLGLHNIKNRYKFLSDKEVEVMISANNFIVSIPMLEEN